MKIEHAAPGARQETDSDNTASLRAVISMLREEPAPGQILARVGTEGRRLSGADVSGILLRAEPHRGWALAARDPEDTGVDDSGLRVPAGAGTLLANVLEHRRPLWADGLLVKPGPDREWAQSLGVDVAGQLPIICEGVVYGVMLLGWREAGPLPVAAAPLVEALAEHAGVALELAALKGELEMGGLRAELTARAEGAETLHRVAAEVAGRRDVHGIATDAVKALLELYAADAGAFYMIDDEGRPRSLVHAGLTAGLVEEVESHYTRRQHRLFQDGRSHVISDVHQERTGAIRKLLLDAGVVTLVRVPAQSEGRIIGALVLYHRHRRPYWPHELALLEAFAVQLAGGLRLAQAYGQLEAADHQREEFLALISHELRHPVAAISTVASVLADTPGLGALERRALEGLRGQAQMLTQLAEEVLSVARLETGMAKPRRTRVDLSSLVEGLVRQGPESERVEVRTPGGSLMARVDPELLGRAVDNLVRNALKYSAAPLPVVLRVWSENGQAMISVEDQGVGLQPREIPLLFKKYGRVRNDRTVGIDGVGLGLYLTRMLIEAHGGTITAASGGPNRGSTFTIRIPRG